jgi:hypothetical protein
MDIRQNIFLVCSGFFKVWFDVRRNQQYFVSKKGGMIGARIYLHSKIATKMKQTTKCHA